jgi:hypothetical protein
MLAVFIDSLWKYADFPQCFSPSQYNLLYISPDISMHIELATAAQAIWCGRSRD